MSKSRISRMNITNKNNKIIYYFNVTVNVCSFNMYIIIQSHLPIACKYNLKYV